MDSQHFDSSKFEIYLKNPYFHFFLYILEHYFLFMEHRFFDRVFQILIFCFEYIIHNFANANQLQSL